MRVPIAWLREYVDLPDDAQAIADRLAMLGFPVDAVEARPQLSGIVAGRIVAMEKHPNADRLQVCTVDVAGEKPLTIATAATNVALGAHIAVATIGARLPNLTIERRKMRGVESEGMMCSAEELALPAEWFEDGIMQLGDNVAPGTDIVALFGLDDAVLDVDVTSNRPDALSIVGLARELAAASGQVPRLPSFENPANRAGEAVTHIVIETPDCTRFVAQRFTEIRVTDAPAWMRVRLALVGQRPINNLVDVANYVMLEMGQPLHFYDEAKIVGGTLTVRDALPGEKIVTLDDATYELTPLAMVVADASGPQCLAGLKGGKSSEVTSGTTAIVAEAANFAGARVRRMSVQLGFRTDASSRHEKSLAPALTDMGAARAAQLLIAMGAVAYVPHAYGDDMGTAESIAFRLADVKRLLGFDLSAERVTQHLEALGCTVTAQGTNALAVVPPPWRRDIRIAADIVEEIARMEGYDNVRAEMPPTFPHAVLSRSFRLERRLATVLADLGYSEIVSYALHGAALFEKLKRADVAPRQPSVEVRNPLSEDQRYLRYALGPGLTEYVARYTTPLRVFEIGHIFEMNDALVEEAAVASFGFTAQPVDEPEWSDRNFLLLKGDALALVHSLTGRIPETVRDVRHGLHPGKTAALLLDGREIAVLGRVHPRMTKAFDVSLPFYIANIYLDALPDYVTPHYQPPSRFPSTYRDLALVVTLDVEAEKISAVAREAAGDLCTAAGVFDEYRSAQLGADRKSVALRITLVRNDATITDEEADATIARVLDALRTKLGATIRE
jgi:phenylalanyl-tRNA synthetase beta chain